MRVFILGANGMLGHVLNSIIKVEYDVVALTRDRFDALKDNIKDVLVDIDSTDVLVNCIGAIPHRKPSIREYIKLNTLLPLEIESYSREKRFKFIHITTDCVFDGSKGCYNELDAHTSSDIYGITKSLGQPMSSTVIRTSIIGRELTVKKSLLEWVRSNRNGTISGYLNHLWNGVTCRTLSNIILEIINKNSYWQGVRHVYSPGTISKYELCKIINDVYGLNIDILAKNDTVSKNMTLTSIYDNIHIIPSIHEQIYNDYIVELSSIYSN